MADEETSKPAPKKQAVDADKPAPQREAPAPKKLSRAELEALRRELHRKFH